MCEQDFWMKINKLRIGTYYLFFLDIGIFLLLLVSYFFKFYNISYMLYSIIVLLLLLNIILKFYIEKICFASIMFIFNVTIFVFLGGRFLSYIYFRDFNPFELTFMGYFLPTKKEELYIFVYFILFIISINSGYFFLDIERKPTYKAKQINKTILNIIFIFALILFAFTIKNSFNEFLNTLKFGYLSLFTHQANEYKSGEGFFKTLTFILLAISSTYNSKKRSIIIYFCLFFYGFILILSGSRGTFITTTLLGFWWVNRNKYVSLKKISIFGVLVFFSMLFLLTFSTRGTTLKTSSLSNAVFAFVKQQGITFPILSYAINDVGSYPFMAYFTNFMPIAPVRIGSVLLNKNFYLYELGFGSYTAYSLNPSAYLSGSGTGWSLLGNFYFFSFGNLLFFTILCFLAGYFIKVLETKTFVSFFWFGMAILILPKLFFVARAEFKSVFMGIILYALIYLLIDLFNRLIKKSIYYE